jgi:uncharacterized LabA/DUF88 family protein
MNHDEVSKFLKNHEQYRHRTMVIVDFGNVEKWKNSLHWKVGIRELARLVKCLSLGKSYLRRFYYGSDYGENESSQEMTPWSEKMLTTARMNGFDIFTKRVKYIFSNENKFGFEKKCDLDVDMTVDLIKERDNYDTIFLFSGDGDLVRALEYLHNEYGKKSVVMGARGHIGREVIDALNGGIISGVLYADDFEYRLNMDRFAAR